MTTWDMDGVAALAVAVGFTGENAAIAAAVSRAENGSGDDSRVNSSAGETPAGQPPHSCVSVGLWQINYCPARDAGRRPTPDQLKDPIANAGFAFQLSGGSNFGPWTTFAHGAHRPYLAAARASVAKFATVGEAQGHVAHVLQFGGDAGPLDPFGQGSILPANPLDAVGTFLALLTSWDTWRRVLMVLAGAAATILGLALVAQDSPTVQSIAAKAGEVAVAA